MFKIVLCAVLFVFADCAYAAPPKPAIDAPIVVLGDSLSSAHRIAPEAGWVHLLEQRLNTAGGLARLPKLLADNKPALVVVELGANDGLRGLPLAEIQANLEKILEAIRDAGARSVLLGIELPINYGPQYRDGLRKMYRALADKFNAPLLPFLLDGVALDPKLMQDDGLHPKAEGEPKVLANVWTVLEPALKSLR
jgi:acyl-CoA thioesterase-1